MSATYVPVELLVRMLETLCGVLTKNNKSQNELKAD